MADARESRGQIDLRLESKQPGRPPGVRDAVPDVASHEMAAGADTAPAAPAAPGGGSAGAAGAAPTGGGEALPMEEDGMAVTNAEAEVEAEAAPMEVEATRVEEGEPPMEGEAPLEGATLAEGATLLEVEATRMEIEGTPGPIEVEGAAAAPAACPDAEGMGLAEAEPAGQ